VSSRGGKAVNRTQPEKLVWLAASLLIAGCATATVRVDSNAAGTPAVTTEPTPVVMQLAFQPEETEACACHDLNEAMRSLATTSLFFETDKSDLSPDGKAKLRRVAEVLRRHPTFKVRIEGNADERGGETYNFVLAKKRACTARDYLIDLDVHPRQVSCESNGSAKPVVPGSGEENWKLNRRNDVVPVDH